MTNQPPPPGDNSETHLREQNRTFWESRGAGAAAARHSSTMLAEHGRFTEYVHHMELAFLQNRLPPQARILDLGCGEGRLALALAPRARDVVGLDISHTLLSRAKHQAKQMGLTHVRFEQHALERPLGVDGFDAVLLSGVLNYLDDSTVALALKRAAAAIRPGGLLYLRNNCANRAAFFSPADGRRPPTHYRTAQHYVECIEKAAMGFRVIEDRYLFAPLLWPNLVYYHVLPRRVRDLHAVAQALDAWFDIEERTSEARLRLLGDIYPPILRLLRKPTSLRVLLARKG